MNFISLVALDHDFQQGMEAHLACKMHSSPHQIKGFFEQLENGEGYF